ncbi:TPA: hypothetical protein RR044_004820 [Klebsiella pneumoniae]|nr:hypothetical protein [Klebsiella pneumoniae]HDZ2196606.1 hypothetical protein [Klebsiella pneumoniae]
MTRLPESSSWEEDIELISRSERVSGGLDGVANRPLKSLANRTRYLKDQADKSGNLINEKVSAVKTFAEGATLESPRDEILHGTYRLVWTGEFPKVVPVASSPETTGGVGAGRWAYTSDAVIRQHLASGKEGMGDSLVTHVQRDVTDEIKTVGQALSVQAPTIWHYAGAVTDRPDVSDPSTWDWGPAFQAAHDNGNIGPILINGETYKIKTPVIYEYTTDDYTKYSRLPRCLTGFAIVDYSELGNGGAGFNAALEVDDEAQPEYEAAFIVKGASGYVVLQEFEGIVFRGNNNTAAIKLIGCDGVRPNRCIFTTNRYGVVFNNGSASGTYAELNAPVFCRWRGGCLTAIAYEKGSGDSSFHGCGLGNDCHVTVTAGRSPVLIGAGCQPYNAPMNANFWMSGVSAPVIRNKGMVAHFHGNLKLEGSFKTVLAEGTAVYFYGPISAWSGINKGTLTQAVRGGPTGPSGGNLNFSGITEPQVTRWDIAAAGTVVAFASYNEEAVVTVTGSSWSSIFKITTGRRGTNNAVCAPVTVIYGNFNPIIKFNITRTSSGLSLTTIDDSTVIVARRVNNLPDESSGNNFRSVDYWRTA